MKDKRKSYDMIKGYLIFMLVIGVLTSFISPWVGLCFASISLTTAAANDKDGGCPEAVRLGKSCSIVLALVSVVSFILKIVLHIYGG